jgi:hypothetical protein
VAAEAADSIGSQIPSGPSKAKVVRLRIGGPLFQACSVVDIISIIGS